MRNFQDISCFRGKQWSPGWPSCRRPIAVAVVGRPLCVHPITHPFPLDLMDMDNKDREIRNELNSGAKASYPPCTATATTSVVYHALIPFFSDKSVPHDDVLSNTLAENPSNLSISALPVPSYSIADLHAVTFFS